MKDLAALKARYLSDPPDVQLGGLASNLARVAWFMRRPGSRLQLVPIFRESKYFAEWAAVSASAKVQAMLGDVQLELALWERRLLNEALSPACAEQSEAWAAKLLDVAGLTTNAP